MSAGAERWSAAEVQAAVVLEDELLRSLDIQDAFFVIDRFDAAENDHVVADRRKRPGENDFEQMKPFGVGIVASAMKKYRGTFRRGIADRFVRFIDARRRRVIPGVPLSKPASPAITRALTIVE